MRKNNYIDGLFYKLKNPQYDEKGQIISTEIYAQSNSWNSYSDSSERMMNRICFHINPELVPDYCPFNEHLGYDDENKLFVEELIFKASKKLY